MTHAIHGFHNLTHFLKEFYLYNRLNQTYDNSMFKQNYVLKNVKCATFTNVFNRARAECGTKWLVTSLYNSNSSSRYLYLAVGLPRLNENVRNEPLLTKYLALNNMGIAASSVIADVFTTPSQQSILHALLVSCYCSLGNQVSSTVWYVLIQRIANLLAIKHKLLAQLSIEGVGHWRVGGRRWDVVDDSRERWRE